MVVVTVGADDFANPTPVHCIDNGQMIVRRIKNHHFLVISDDPNVVGYVEILTIEGEDAVGGNQFNAHPKGLAQLSPPATRVHRAKWHLSRGTASHCFAFSLGLPSVSAEFPRITRRRALRTSPTPFWLLAACIRVSQQHGCMPSPDCLAALHLHYGTQDFATLHFVEGRFDVAETNSFADKTVEGQAALEVELDEHREVA